MFLFCSFPSFFFFVVNFVRKSFERKKRKKKEKRKKFSKEKKEKGFGSLCVECSFYFVLYITLLNIFSKNRMMFFREKKCYSFLCFFKMNSKIYFCLF